MMSGFIADTSFQPRQFDRRDETPRIVAEFFTKPMEDKEAEKRLGHAVFVDVDHCRWHKRGSNLSATECKIATLPKLYPHIWPVVKPAYEAWKGGRDEEVQGTALKNWPMVSPAMVLNLRAINIRSVEELADTTEADFQRIGPGARDLREKARAWLKVANETGRIAAELKSRDDEIAALKDALTAAREDIQELRGALDRVQPREHRGPGRPRKVVEA